MITKIWPPRLCPFSVFDYPCEKRDCQGCDIMAEFEDVLGDYEPSYRHWKNILGVKRITSSRPN